MKDVVSRKGFVALLVAGLFSLSLVIAPSNAWAADDHEKLEEHMDAINTAYKKLRKGVANASENKANAKLVAEMQKHTVEAKLLTPPRAGKEAKKDEFVMAYQKSMNALLIQLVNLEDAFLDGKNADAEGILKKINDMKNAEHEKFQVQE